MSFIKKFEGIKSELALPLEENGYSREISIEKYISKTLVSVEGKPLLMLASSNYLSLALDTETIEAANSALAAYGSSSASTRPAGGTFAYHKNLEAKLSLFLQKKYGILFPNGPLTHFSSIPALTSQAPYLLIDEDSHAAIFDACKLSRAKVEVFAHNNVRELEARLNSLPPEATAIIVVEGVYSMLGDRAPLADIAEVKRRRGAYLYINESHSLGALGETGAGAAEEAGILQECDYITASLGKALAATGGILATDSIEARSLILANQTYNYSTSLSPAGAASALSAISTLRENPALRKKLWENARHFYEEIAKLGFDTSPLASPIIPVFIGDAALTQKFWRGLLENGILCNYASPLRSKTKGYIRVSMQAALSESEIEQAVSVFRTLGKERGIIQ